ncbi:Outer membrane protein beta-barrel domain-containing protein [Chitinophaga sp. CF118]|uniref:porin family protein n=1 Tax=Chitinophaga sp. CF118 TaxID=1884367 RepID=UPI0008F12DDC|nr:porin family protein [Chitinophaga sp. CF118]SFE70836.1 Outer membrane protein beta-barrel domain-containing protein [Chitinophaga sp. CF118]
MIKKTILSFTALAISFGAMSQARVGVKGGWNLSSISVDNNGSVDKDKSLSGFNIGLIADFPLVPKILSFQPGVFYTTKGAKLESGDKNNSGSVYRKYTTTPSYIEIPLNFVGKIPVGPGTNLFAGLGPYIAFGVAGKNKVSSTVAGVTTSTESNIKWDDDTPFNSGDANQGFDKYKRFDYGGNLLVGAEIRGLILSAQYGLGLAKINSGSSDNNNDKNKNRVFSLSAGFLF